MIRILLAAALLLHCARPPATVVHAPLEWRDCHTRFTCASLDVPVDHARPEGKTLALALVRRAAEKPEQRIGVLLVNPGGPGISAVESLRWASSRYGAALRERFDLLAFDTRGTGASTPLDCHASLDALLAHDPTPETDAEFAAIVSASRALAEECAAKHGELLPYLGTRESAQDMDLVREVLGESQVSYLGFSYGTALGAVYATRFPERVRAMVLDGAIEPSFDLLVFAREQSASVEGAFKAYDVEAARTGWHGTDVLEAVTARAEKAPIPSSGGGRPARATDVLYGSVETVISPGDGWHELAAALGAAQAGDGGPFVRFSDRYFQRAPDGSSALRVEAQLGVLCADLHRPASPDAYRAAIPELAAESPHVGVANLMSLLPCAFWPEPAHAPIAPELDDASRILVIAGSDDPLTPGAWGARLAERLRGSTLLDVESDVHTAYARDDACTDRIVERLLVSLEHPESPARCPSAIPEP